ncbi:MAG: hypothetical protein GY749_12590 [Desulfobacteraceae bacterium]|nr:hypothetical protein [Desulfobacteraceae bacterium]
MQHVTINVPDNYPTDRLRKKIIEIEESLKKETETILNKTRQTEDSNTEPRFALDTEAITVDTNRTDGYVSHKQCMPEKNPGYLFLNDDVWDGENTPPDLAENHDFYLYGQE